MKKIGIIGGAGDALHYFIEKVLAQEKVSVISTAPKIKHEPNTTMEITRDFEHPVITEHSRKERRGIERKMHKTIKPKFKGKSNPFKK